MDGSEEGEVLPAAVLSGAPIELQARTVRYVRPISSLSRNPPVAYQQRQSYIFFLLTPPP